MQSCLEKKGIEERNQEIIRNDYSGISFENEYSAMHSDAISDGDVKGKGTKHGGHTSWKPNCELPKTTIDYSNFDTLNGGGKYDIEGRNDVGGRLKSIVLSEYNSEHQYGANLIDTNENVSLGQFQNK